MELISLGGMISGTDIAVAGLGLGAAGMIGQGNAASAAAKGQQAVSEYNAKVAQQQGKAEEQATLFKQGQQEQAAARQASSLQAAAGASGAVTTEGAPLQIQGVQAQQSEMDNLMLGYQGQIAQQQSLNQSQLDELQAGIYGQQASNAQTAGLMGAGTSLLTGFGKMAMAQKYGY
jgi:hypothetical protein